MVRQMLPLDCRRGYELVLCTLERAKSYSPKLKSIETPAMDGTQEQPRDASTI